MGALRHWRRRLSAALVFCIFAAALSPLILRLTTLVGVADEARGIKAEEQVAVLPRRRLGGPGSSPPTCRNRCGGCSPCQPVRVAIHPGQIVPLEYYPEAWRCRCGDELFMP